jgi:hypothetical protein
MRARTDVRNIYIYLYNVKFKRCVDLPSRDLWTSRLSSENEVRP